MDLEEWFKKEEESKDVSRELFSNTNIKTRTEVSDDEIYAIAKINFLCDLFELKRFPAVVQEMLELRVSKKRKSRGEFIKSLSSRNEPNILNPFQNNRGFN